MKTIKFRYWYPNRGMFTDYSLKDFTLHCTSKLFELEPPAIFMQFTGLKDINGNEIYERDIVKDLTPYADLYETEGLYENNKVIIPLLVVWSDDEARFYLVGAFNEEDKYYQYNDQLHCRRLEIIGNIYENPELMRAI